MAPELSVHTGQNSPRSRRSHSISSDRPSLSGYGGLLTPPTIVSPDPAFIAASAASQIVTNDHDSQADTWFDQHGIEPSGETALVAPPALKLVNRFLDQLLFNFLSVSRSTSLASLRPAVAEVLKPKLAKEAINGADQELQEYLGGGEEEELLAFHNGLEPNGDWDIELVWKRTRLRCMVYSSLGDMEEEDEDYYTEQEQLDGPPGSTNRFSNNPGVVSPAVAIFLTSILEFMGEQVLVVAGQAAYYKLRSKHEKEERDGTSTPADIAERVVVEDTDMEKVAMDRTLGRLWRGWKKRIRSPTTSVSLARSFSRESMQSQPYSSKAASVEESIPELARRPSLAAVLAEYEYAAGIPLPMNDNDIREIEIPGLAHQSDDEDEEVSEDEGIVLRPRPKSMLGFNLANGLLTPNSSQPHSPVFATNGRKRANSLPSPAQSIYTSPKRVKSEDTAPEEAVPEVPAGEEKDVVMKDEDEDSTNESAAKDLNEKHADESKEGETNSGLIAGVVAGASAIGAAAVAGIVAVAQGSAPQTEPVVDDTDAEEEEPQIMTSSRVSLPPAGPVSPEFEKDPKLPSRHSSVRSTSVHSLRIIDVAARSPVMSRSPSVDHTDFVNGRPFMTSRPSSVHSPIMVDTHASPRVGSPVSRGPTASPITRNGSSLSTRHARHSGGDPISEVEERDPKQIPTSTPVDLATSNGIDNSPSQTPTSQYSPESLHREVAKAPFVLAAAPNSRSIKDQSGATAPVAASSTLPTTSTAVNSHLRSADNGIPPLTPLREMTENAYDTDPSVPSTQDSHHDPMSYTMSVANQRNGKAPVEPINTQNLKSYDAPRSPLLSRGQQPRTKPELKKPMTESGTTPPRQLHTSGSGSSASSNKRRPTRTSEESTQKSDKGASFEQLIRSDQTIQYTLTPQNMRDIEAPDSPRYSQPPFTDARPPTSRSHSSSVSRHTALQANPITERTIVAITQPLTRPASNGPRLRSNAPQPRDARVVRDSMGDFTEFIKSTAPSTANQPRAPLNITAPPKRTASSAGRARLQARAAAVPRGQSISDLIDFVKAGPQLDKDTHRIDRRIAPFRTTMDSDQMAEAVGGKAIDASLSDARYTQSVSGESSFTSQTVLIKSNVNKPLPVQAPKAPVNDFDEDMMPKRKTRRVRDPYAIDLSDDDEEAYATTGSKAKPIVEEESLADFLRNVPPPPPEPTSAFEGVVRPGPTKSKTIKKKSSTPGLMARFGRSNSSPNIAQVKPSAPPPPMPKPLYTPIAAKYSPTYGLNNGSSISSSANSNHGPRGATGKVVQKRYEPREASYGTASSGTKDLANFLKLSEPPSSLSMQPQTFAPTIQKEEKGSFQRMFGRKKAHA